MCFRIQRRHRPSTIIFNNRPLRFTFFRQCLTGTIRDEWDNISALQPPTCVGFQAAITNLLHDIIRPTDLADQRHYLETSKKPYIMTCAVLASRLEMINKLMSLFPGAHGHPPWQP